MEPDTPHEPTLAESLTPAPYGSACVACSRGKCKCFYRSDGSGCERCHRLGKACKQTASIRKRRTRKASSRSVQPPPPRDLLEEKLDKVISILRSQASTKQLVEQTIQDLLLGIICFASWSHYFKKDKPFMTMLTQMAVSMAFELDLHKDTAPGISPRDKPRRLLTRQTSVRPVRTIEERRTFAALYYLTSATWAAYRKTYPLDWTPYLEDCARVLSQGTETSLDILLTTQIRCQLITNGITCPINQNMETEGCNPPSRLLYTALLKQLDDIRQSLPDDTELKIKEFFLRHRESNHQHNGTQIRRVQDLESALAVIEHLLAVFDDLPILDWVGISVDYVTQLTHCLVVLFKLNTLKEPGWDLLETRKRADVIQILDQYAEKVESALEIIEIVEMTTNMTYVNAEEDIAEELPSLTADNIVLDDLVMSLAQESWLSNLIEDPWDYVGQLNETEYLF
ncbi:hypothetical protein GGI42DRAFT_338665 [Trichoderma sp. SZMC 28013]